MKSVRTVVLNDGTEFVGKRVFNFLESWGEVTYRVLSSNKLSAGSKVKVRLNAISYIVEEPKGK